jgi:membrane protease YdiL (CAAX protease family)
MAEINSDEQNYERIPVESGSSPEKPEEVDMPTFRKSRLTYFSLFLLLFFWPASSLVFMGNPMEALKLASASPILMIYLPTIAIQWVVFLLIALTVLREGTGFRDIGFKPIRIIDFFWAGAFLLASNLILSLLAVSLKILFGLEISGELELLLPKTNIERVFWIILSLTAGICEETAFRGYLITRLKIVGRFKNYLVPIFLASLAFGSGHIYQGAGGFILLSIYGAMFALLFWRTGSLWPPIIAHFFQDFSALFFPFQK